MEQRDGLIEFRTTTTEEVTYNKGHERDRHVTIREVLEYRQCFKGIWQPWKPVK